MLNLDELASALTPHAMPPSVSTPRSFSPAELAREARQAKADYQGCRYAAASGKIPRLLNALEQADLGYDEAARQHLNRVKADAYHVAASVLLKCDERGLAWLAADRSFRAAEVTQDPVLIGSSSRVYVRALMRERRYRAAVDLAVSSAEQVRRQAHPSTSASLSVYGSLLLSGAVAAAKREDRDSALSLLAEATDAARRLGGDHNHRWTAFGPSNVLLHRVSTAVELGDAGQAVEQARRVRLEHVHLPERRVVLHVDTARAFTQWGKLREAYTELTAAESLAPEELKERPVVHNLIEELRARSSGHLKRGLTQLADRVGVAR
ncbi:XRE family transcriptional regulator [Nocardiopsis dassonvillei]|uniref:XRE family transcriptional regulator n=1 Tax=Nocardiopsis dassonvillei TaxID=2014 RepID=UPI00366CC90A